MTTAIRSGATDLGLIVNEVEQATLASTGLSIPAATAAAHAMNQAQFVNGWINDVQTWTCTTAGVAGTRNTNGSINATPVSAVFTVPGNQTATFVKGTKLKWTQTTVKYGYVLSSSFGAGVTTVTLVANSSYQMVLSGTTAITLNAFSFGRPSGFPALFGYMGACIPTTGSYTTVTTPDFYFSMDGGLITAMCTATLTDITGGSGSAVFYLPMNASTVSLYTGCGRDRNTGVALAVHIINTAYVGVYTYANATEITNGNIPTITITYS